MVRQFSGAHTVVGPAFTFQFLNSPDSLRFQLNHYLLVDFKKKTKRSFVSKLSSDDPTWKLDWAFSTSRLPRLKTRCKKISALIRNSFEMC